ncbi:hypothetical protein [Gloeobacter kilaueensis]|uniref:Uncharacterized protein n=1 Tax=Gloeobacter kilaueensis (strain ATCC BAA-2537 / CCAP 1431/1 / ULC 316 / JS1) TaxID=1183438 RepID=U5QF21_GLOK1|nr:hypothetical protein [Gloeobacter kilaueensis]AGY57557.1 hypothetical protein GKIL_1311 [Gloeobacter kilaueensis JS1]
MPEDIFPSEPPEADENKPPPSEGNEDTEEQDFQPEESSEDEDEEEDDGPGTTFDEETDFEAFDDPADWQEDNEQDESQQIDLDDPFVQDGLSGFDQQTFGGASEVAAADNGYSVTDFAANWGCTDNSEIGTDPN